eukprot:CAMPEP_0201695518 /NCGR_PEP_ID=MMETSP0578-20130828/7426_1 /ASSEMBLY_ACC=CAM_ASM_000663 /TAXON_ID=267565 /ORGANISM="Skeletonema grethea, Strain CCMP 1804" /LENGTH=263 /DNA_ID=CAMNT_0048181365 /DNA_START=49 /DNA_END=840 /DNA_ORIENTATION=+
MTALNRSKANETPPIDGETSQPEPFVPSVSEDEAKTRFTASVAEGVDFLMRRGMGRERASRELLNMIADGCSPDEEEIFKVMETRGLSFYDATRVMTVAAAFNIARKKGAATESIDQLTSRLNFSRLTISTGTRSPSSLSPNKKSIIISRQDSVGSFSPVAITKKNQRTKGKTDKASRTVPKGKKRALAETTTTTQARTEDANKSCADREVKEKMLNAKLKDGNRAKSPEAKPRMKRASTQQLEESQPKKRVRATPEAASCSI